MDTSKKAAFVRAMGKRQKFSKGGMIRKLGNRHYYDTGGAVNTNVLSGPAQLTSNNATNPNTGVLGSIGGALGLNNNFQAGSASITPGTSVGQLNTAYGGAQNALTNQNNLATTLQPQAQTAVNNQNAVANQELGIVNGTGPNPALAQLAQTTGQNVNAQAALQAGQRGASGNVGLMARQIGQQGAATQEAGVGQAATLSAQNQIAAGQNLAGLSNNQVAQAGSAITGQNTAQQNEQNILQGANTAANNAAVGMQSNINNVNAATAAGNQSQANNILGDVGSAASSIFGSLAHGGMVKEDHVKLAEMNAAALKHGRANFDAGGPVSFGGQYSAVQQPGAVNIAAPMAMPAVTDKYGGDAASTAIKAYNDAAAQKATNDQVKNSLSELNNTPQLQQPVVGDSAIADLTGQSSMLGDQSLGSVAPSAELQMPGMGSGSGFARGGQICEGPHGHVAAFLAQGGSVPAMVSPGERYLSPEEVRQVIHEGKNPLKLGKKIPGKPKVKGDSLKNDVVPATLEEGGVVLPRHITSKMSPEKAELFVHRAAARRKAGK